MVLARIVRSKGPDKVAVLNKQLFASADRPSDGNDCLRALLDLKLTISLCHLRPSRHATLFLREKAKCSLRGKRKGRFYFTVLASVEDVEGLCCKPKYRADIIHHFILVCCLHFFLSLFLP